MTTHFFLQILHIAQFLLVARDFPARNWSWIFTCFLPFLFIAKLPKWFGERPGKKAGDPDTPEGEEDVKVEEDEEVEEEEVEEEVSIWKFFL